MWDSFLNLTKYGLQILLLLPTLIKVISETVEAVEAIGGPGTGAVKKQAVLAAVDAAFDMSDTTEPNALQVDREALRGVSSNLVETVLDLQKAAQKRDG